MTTADAPQRIAYLTSRFPAVSHTFILREVEALRDMGFEICTCSIRRPGPEELQGAAEQAAAGCTFYVLSAARNPWTLLAAQAQLLTRPKRYFSALWLALKTGSPGLRALVYQLFYFAEATILARHLQQQNVRHLHNHFADVSANVAMLTAELADIPFSYTLHGPIVLYEPKRWRLDAKTARARFVACISHFARSQAMYFSDPEHWPKLRIVHCGVTPELYDRPATSKEAGTHMVFVGRLAPIKGVRVLLEAFETARQTRPDLTLSLVGDGDDRAHLEKVAAPLGSSVRFLGYRSQDEVADILANADALVLPSFAEGLPVVLMEALAAGKPVVCTQVAGVSELVEDGVNGYLVPAGDAESLADRIGRISDDPGRSRRMGEAGRTKVKEEFNVRKEAARIAALFQGTGGTRPRPDPIYHENRD